MKEATFNLNISKLVTGPAALKSAAGLPFEPIKNHVLGPKYQLNLNLITPAESKKLNLKYRAKNHSTDILSFPLSKDEGEIYLDLKTSATEAVKFDRPFENFLLFLFIHGLFHLKGLDHGAKMEKLEVTCRRHFQI
ncbi:MAG: rRNA maturation RNase YbeY [Candidatus Paceibacterota bacterium]|jgi:probable rRNA maturation factor